LNTEAKMVVNTITDAKAQLSSLIERVQNGEEVIIKKAGRPVAILTPYTERATARVAGALAGQIRISSDFDELPDDVAEVLGMKR